MKWSKMLQEHRELRGDILQLWSDFLSSQFLLLLLAFRTKIINYPKMQHIEDLTLQCLISARRNGNGCTTDQ